MLKYNLITKIGIHLKKRIKEVNAGIKKENNLPFQNILILILLIIIQNINNEMKKKNNN